MPWLPMVLSRDQRSQENCPNLYMNLQHFFELYKVQHEMLWLKHAFLVLLKIHLTSLLWYSLACMARPRHLSIRDYKLSISTMQRVGFGHARLALVRSLEATPIRPLQINSLFLSTISIWLPSTLNIPLFRYFQGSVKAIFVTMLAHVSAVLSRLRFYSIKRKVQA